MMSLSRRPTGLGLLLIDMCPWKAEVSWYGKNDETDSDL